MTQNPGRQTNVGNIVLSCFCCAMHNYCTSFAIVYDLVSSAAVAKQFTHSVPISMHDASWDLSSGLFIADS